MSYLSDHQKEFMFAAVQLVTRVGFFIEDIEAKEIDTSKLPNYDNLVSLHKISMEKLNKIPEGME